MEINGIKRKIVVVLDSFKGCLSSYSASCSLAEGIKYGLKMRHDLPEIDVEIKFLADGGEGFAYILSKVMGCKSYHKNVIDALGREIDVPYFIDESKKMGFFDMASVVGLPMLRANERNPLKTTTYGCGELASEIVRNMIKMGEDSECVDRLIVGFGGSSTNDAGLGFLQGLGVKVFDKRGELIREPICGKDLKRVGDLSLSEIEKNLKNVDWCFASDVNNPFIGENGASRVFAPQKGADITIVEELEEGMVNVEEVIRRVTGEKIADMPGAGAAGGACGGLWAVLKGSGISVDIAAGAEIILELQKFKETLRDAILVVTGEGKADSQTLMGKGPSVVLRNAQYQDVKCIIVAGKTEDCEKLKQGGFYNVININEGRDERNMFDEAQSRLYSCGIKIAAGIEL